MHLRDFAGGEFQYYLADDGSMWLKKLAKPEMLNVADNVAMLKGELAHSIAKSKGARLSVVAHLRKCDGVLWGAMVCDGAEVMNACTPRIVMRKRWPNAMIFR